MILRLLLALALLTPGAALADPARDAVKAGIERCDPIADNRQWLDCVYGAAQPMRAALGLPPAPQSQVRLVPPAQAMVPPPRPAPQPAPQPAPRVASAPPRTGMFDDLFGSGMKLATRLHLQSYSFNKDGSFTVTLEDGQVWKQNSPPAARPPFNGPAANYVVDITAGVMGSHNMKIAGIPTTFKVHRLE